MGHTHDRDFSLVQAVNHVSWRHTHSRNEQSSAAFNDDVHKLVEMPVSIVIVCFPRIAANLGYQEVDSEWSAFIVQAFLELVDLLLEHLGSATLSAGNGTSAVLSYTANDT